MAIKQSFKLSSSSHFPIKRDIIKQKRIMSVLNYIVKWLDQLDNSHYHLVASIVEYVRFTTELPNTYQSLIDNGVIDILEELLYCGDDNDEDNYQLQHEVTVVLDCLYFIRCIIESVLEHHHFEDCDPIGYWPCRLVASLGPVLKSTSTTAPVPNLKVYRSSLKTLLKLCKLLGMFCFVTKEEDNQWFLYCLTILSRKLLLADLDNSDRIYELLFSVYSLASAQCGKPEKNFAIQVNYDILQRLIDIFEQYYTMIELTSQCWQLVMSYLHTKQFKFCLLKNYVKTTFRYISFVVDEDGNPKFINNLLQSLETMANYSDSIRTTMIQHDVLGLVADLIESNTITDPNVKCSIIRLLFPFSNSETEYLEFDTLCLPALVDDCFMLCHEKQMVLHQEHTLRWWSYAMILLRHRVIQPNYQTVYDYIGTDRFTCLTLKMMLTKTKLVDTSFEELPLIYEIFKYQHIEHIECFLQSGLFDVLQQVMNILLKRILKSSTNIDIDHFHSALNILKMVLFVQPELHYFDTLIHNQPLIQSIFDSLWIENQFDLVDSSLFLICWFIRIANKVQLAQLLDTVGDERLIEDLYCFIDSGLHLVQYQHCASALDYIMTLGDEISEDIDLMYQNQGPSLLQSGNPFLRIAFKRSTKPPPPPPFNLIPD